MKRPWARLSLGRWSSAPESRPAPDQPLVIAHRGDSQRWAEHTLAAYEAAIDAGADGLECDVRLTRDGHLVCVHDRRVDRTSNGTGVVSDLDLARLQQLDFASWHDSWPESADQLLGDDDYLAGVAPDRDRTTGTVLRLDALLALAADAPRPLRLLIETKHPTRYAGLVEKELVRTLARYRFPTDAGRGEQPVTVMSFAYTALRRVHLLAPAIPTVLLQDRWRYTRRTGELPGVTGVAGPSLALLREDPDFVARCHQRGHGVYVWTVDTREDLDFTLALGVDAVISNRPADAVARRSALLAAE